MSSSTPRGKKHQRKNKKITSRKATQAADAQKVAGKDNGVVHDDDHDDDDEMHYDMATLCSEFATLTEENAFPFTLHKIFVLYNMNLYNKLC